MPDYPTLADLGDDAPPAPSETVTAAVPDGSRQLLDWLTAEGFRVRLDEDGDLHLRHEGRDVYVVLDPGDPVYVRFVAPDLYVCDDEAEAHLALVVANDLTGALKTVKVFLARKRAVLFSIELFLDGFEAFRAVALRCLELLGTAAWEFRARMREARQQVAEETAEGAGEGRDAEGA